MKSFTELANHLNDQEPGSEVRETAVEPKGEIKSLVAEMASKLSLDEPVVRRGIVETVHSGGSAFAVLGSGQSVFITRSIAKRLGIVEGDVLEMTIVGNYKDAATDAVPYRALFAVHSRQPLRSEEPAPAPAPAPEPVPAPAPAPEPAPEPVYTKPMTFKDVMAPKMLAAMKPGFLYRSSDFAVLTNSEKSRALTNVLEALLADGRVQRVAVHSSPDKKAGRLYWCLPGQGTVILDGLCSGNLGD